jgi:hypothetical protein
MVRYMSEVPPRATGDPLASRVLPQVQNVLVTQARKYLEDRFVQPRFHPISVLGSCYIVFRWCRCAQFRNLRC